LFILVLRSWPIQLTNRGEETALHRHTDVFLPAGFETTVSFTSPLLAGAGVQGMEPFIQLFDSKGREIMTNQVEKAWRYYALLEMERHQRAMKNTWRCLLGKIVRPFPLFTLNPFSLLEPLYRRMLQPS
jgi:hypothetical protein